MFLLIMSGYWREEWLSLAAGHVAGSGADTQAPCARSRVPRSRVQSVSSIPAPLFALISFSSPVTQRVPMGKQVGFYIGNVP
jgi:hypothetical protein